MSAVDPISQLPNELWIYVFRNLPPREIYLSVAQTCRRFRRLIQNNTKRLPLIRAHCHLYVIDVDYCEGERNDERDPMIQYTFTAYDTGRSDYVTKRRSCARGNDLNFRALYIGHRSGQLLAEFESVLQESYKPSKIDPITASTLLSYMWVEAMRFEVLKKGRKLTYRLADERFVHGLQFCENHCAKLSLRSLTLNSQNPNFTWTLGEESMSRLLRLNTLESLNVENMQNLDVFTGKVHVPLSNLKVLRLRFDPRHRSETENTLWLNIDGDFLLELLPAAVRNIDLNLYTDLNNAITGITATHMCRFIKGWRGQLHPWHIKYISFNTTTTISEFRTAASLANLFTQHHLVDIPYCRFRTHHPSDPNVLLELGCYGNGLHTMDNQKWLSCDFPKKSINVACSFQKSPWIRSTQFAAHIWRTLRHELGLRPPTLG